MADSSQAERLVLIVWPIDTAKRITGKDVKNAANHITGGIP